MSCITFIITLLHFYNDTNSFSRIVKYTCFAVTQRWNRMAALCIWEYWQVIIPQSQYLKWPPIALTTAWHLYSNESICLSICACVVLFHSSLFTAWGSMFLIRLSRFSKSCSMCDRSSHDRSWSRTTWRVLNILLFGKCNFFCGQNHLLWHNCAFTDRFLQKIDPLMLFNLRHA